MFPAFIWMTSRFRLSNLQPEVFELIEKSKLGSVLVVTQNNSQETISASPGVDKDGYRSQWIENRPTHQNLYCYHNIAHKQPAFAGR